MRKRLKELFPEEEDQQQNWTYYERKDDAKCKIVTSNFSKFNN
jgi:hypothetical protein